jgi:hypothetical protein
VELLEKRNSSPRGKFCLEENGLNDCIQPWTSAALIPYAPPLDQSSKCFLSKLFLLKLANLFVVNTEGKKAVLSRKYELFVCTRRLQFCSRYAVVDVNDVHLYYTMANLSMEEILDEHVQSPVHIEKVQIFIALSKVRMCSLFCIARDAGET